MTLKQIYMYMGLLVGIILLGVVAITSWYTVDESEQAVILTFGEAEESITQPGLHFKMPWPVQSVEKLSKETFSLDFGFSDEDGEKANEVKMITGDDYIVMADLVVQWKITEPNKYLFNATNPEHILNNATSASLRGVIGSSEIDEALTNGKADIENRVRENLIGLIETYDIGISVLDVKLQEVDLPNEDVRKAFTKVTDAKETKNTKQNEAEKYKNQQTEEALGEKDAIISRAEGDKVERIEKAKGDVAQFNALYSEYEQNKEVTRDRLIIETLEDVLPQAKIYIMNDDGNTMKYLPLDPANTKKEVVPPKEEQNQAEEGESSNE
ncbi:tail fiber protein [Pontibacillus halophilus JSM 076056 = DSM 19796]|uniref:Protein HflK n=1 Tax=Pontibacillus halophilus JSM 076056 = DSM 19796 TaxID=1385510 RepID=A0A0A5GQ70_9BACI|nr:FtsH protease activity modulator HflK [Pontibacillus halophilus]KGX93388.1 tail fiber protein [Pontibacillus halophilus JSM 076056 = DSM 19796]